jgi:hypothetical protein
MRRSCFWFGLSIKDMFNPITSNIGVGPSILRDSKESITYSRLIIPRLLMLLAFKDD